MEIDGQIILKESDGFSYEVMTLGFREVVFNKKTGQYCILWVDAVLTDDETVIEALVVS